MNWLQADNLQNAVWRLRERAATPAWRLITCALFVLISWWLIAPDPTAGSRMLRNVQLAFVSGYLIHFCVYGFVTTLLLSAVVPWSARAFRLVVVALVTHAVLTECVQALVPTRHPDPLDACANLAGITVAAGGLCLFRQLLLRPAVERCAEPVPPVHAEPVAD